MVYFVVGLGISLVGHRDSEGDGGIFVGAVKLDSPAYASGAIEPGDLIVDVNGRDLTAMSNDAAMRTVMTEIRKGGTLRLVLGKVWDNISNCSEAGISIGGASQQDLSCLESDLFDQGSMCTRYCSSETLSSSSSSSSSTSSSSERAAELALEQFRGSSVVRKKPSRHHRHRHSSTRTDHSRIGPGNSDLRLPSATAAYPGENTGHHHLRRSTDCSCCPLSPSQRPFRGFELVEWIEAKFADSTYVTGGEEATPREFAQRMLDRGEILDAESSDWTRFSERGFYLIPSPSQTDYRVLV